MTSDPIKRFALRVLRRMDGQPCPMDTLRDSLHITFGSLPVGDLDAAVHQLEAEGYIIGSNIDLVGIVWSLTPKGQLKANQLG